MKVYAAFPDIKRPNFLDTNGEFDSRTYQKREEAYLAAMRQRLIDKGYTGEHTGKEFCVPWADGHARYMVMQRGKVLQLMHLPLGDGWDVPAYMTRGLRNADVLLQVRHQRLVRMR